jgi:hypothetical protein
VENISTPLAKIKLNWFPLSFSGEFEKAYREYFFHDSLRLVRIALAVGLFFYGLLCFLYACVVP